MQSAGMACAASASAFDKLRTAPFDKLRTAPCRSPRFGVLRQAQGTRS